MSAVCGSYEYSQRLQPFRSSSVHAVVRSDLALLLFAAAHTETGAHCLAVQ